jgi:hypothetical protein
MKEMEGMGGLALPNKEICCPDCWGVFLAVDPEWDWASEGWQYRDRHTSADH